MADENNDQKQEISFLDMSDEDIMKMTTPVFTTSTEDNPEEKVEETKSETKVDDENSEDSNKEETQKTDTQVDGNKSVEADEKKSEDKSPDGKPQEEVKKPEEANKEESATLSNDQIVEKLFAPFKANGRDMKVDNIDEALDLMKMGANYNKKMQGLKPGLKVLKTLQNNGIIDEKNNVDEDKLNFMMDLLNKNPEAISKLIKDSGSDPLDLGEDKASNYKPTNHKVSDKEMEFDGVLDEISDSPTAVKTLNLVANDWDADSRKFAAQNPQVLKVINGHMETGVYDLISARLDKERALGRLKGLSDIAAYQQVGDAMNANGEFNHIFAGSSQKKEQTAPVKEVIVEPKLKQAENDDQRNEKRKAAGGNTPVAKADKKADFNPLAMSDEDFAKLKPKFS